MVLDASSFLLITVPMLRFSASVISWMFSTSAIDLATPASLAVRHARILVSELSVSDMNASILAMPSSRSRSVSRASPHTISQSGHRSARCRHLSRSMSMILEPETVAGHRDQPYGYAAGRP